MNEVLKMVRVTTICTGRSSTALMSVSEVSNLLFGCTGLLIEVLG